MPDASFSSSEAKNLIFLLDESSPPFDVNLTFLYFRLRDK